MLALQILIPIPVEEELHCFLDTLKCKQLAILHIWIFEQLRR